MARTRSPFRGVSWCKGRRRWRVDVYHEGKSTLMGCFDDEVEAAKAYDE
jgi:hypothetical protein